MVEADPTGVAEKLSGFAALIESDHSLAQVLSNPTFSIKERTNVLGRILKKLGWGAPLDRFLTLLLERHRIGLLGAIAEEFSLMVDEAQGRIRVTVKSAVELEEDSAAGLRRALAKGLEKQVVLEQKVQPELIA